MQETHKPEPPAHLRGPGPPDPAAFGRTMADIAQRSQRIVGEWLKRQAQETPELDPLNIGSAFMEMTARLMANPAKLMQAQFGFWQDYMALWQSTARRMMGDRDRPRDRRRTGRPPLQGRRPGSDNAAVRLHQAVLPARARATCRTPSASVDGLDRQDRAEGRFLHAPVRRCAGAVELRC